MQQAGGGSCGFHRLLDEYLANEAYIAANVWETVQVNGINVVIVNNQRVGA